MNSPRKTAIIVGVLFIIATFTYSLGDYFLGPILSAPNFLTNVSANSTQVIMAVLLELICAAAVVGITVMMFPIFKKHNEALALGYVGARIIEGVLYIVAVISLLSLLTLSQEYVKAGAPDASYFQTLGTFSMATRFWAYETLVIFFSLGALIFYYLLYQSRLIPRWLSVWGLIGAILWLAEVLLVMFGLLPPSSVLEYFFTTPIFLQEMVLAVWLIVKGFNPSAIASGSTKTDTNKV